MSTPAMTIVKNHVIDHKGSHDVNVMKFYRHWDGYPSGHGFELAKALMRASGKSVNNRNWAQHFMSAFLDADTDYPVDVEFIGPDDSTDYGQCYTYVIIGRYEDLGGKHSITPEQYRENVIIKVYMGNLNGTLLFAGDANEFMAWKELKM